MNCKMKRKKSTFWMLNLLTMKSVQFQKPWVSRIIWITPNKSSIRSPSKKFLSYPDPYFATFANSIVHNIIFWSTYLDSDQGQIALKKIATFCNRQHVFLTLMTNKVVKKKAKNMIQKKREKEGQKSFKLDASFTTSAHTNNDCFS